MTTTRIASIYLDKTTRWEWCVFMCWNDSETRTIITHVTSNRPKESALRIRALIAALDCARVEYTLCPELTALVKAF